MRKHNQLTLGGYDENTHSAELSIALQDQMRLTKYWDLSYDSWLSLKKQLVDILEQRHEYGEWGNYDL